MNQMLYSTVTGKLHQGPNSYDIELHNTTTLAERQNAVQTIQDTNNLETQRMQVLVKKFNFANEEGGFLMSSCW